MLGLSEETAGIYARRIECDLKRGRYDAAIYAINEAQRREIAFRSGDFLDLDIVEAGVDMYDASVLNSVGIFTVAQLEQETVSSLQEIVNIGEKRAIEIFDRIEGHRAMFKIGTARL